MKARIINQNYTATADMRVLTRLPYTISKPWLVSTNGKQKTFRTHTGAIRWAEKLTRKGKA